MAALPTRLVCPGCGFEAPAAGLPPFRCPRAGSGDGAEHLLARVLDPAALGPRGEVEALFHSPEENPFRAYRRLLHSYQAARAAGIADGDYLGSVAALDAAVARVDGRGLRRTPFFPAAELGRELGIERLWVKDETGNVAGSHKARHLMGLALWLEVAGRLGGPTAGSTAAAAGPLAIASCGNAALAAGVVARAAGRRLEVFVPPHADPAVVDRLERLRAHLVTCPRRAGEAGDPCIHRFREAVAAGALPFTCQGPENGLVIEGGQTLAWEMVSTLLAAGATLDRLFVQVGGGALATAVIQGLREAVDLGLLARLPRLHAVQTRGGSPLARAYQRLAARILGEGFPPKEGAAATAPELAARAERIRRSLPPAAVDAALRYAARHRSEFMWPWEEEPRSIATGILDDETYDWLAVVRGMLATGGFPLVVSERSLAEANRLGREATGIGVDATGTAGLAGCLELARAGLVARDETAAVLFTGALRSPS